MNEQMIPMQTTTFKNQALNRLGAGVQYKAFAIWLGVSVIELLSIGFAKFQATTNSYSGLRFEQT
jgi:hypothetical protein